MGKNFERTGVTKALAASLSDDRYRQLPADVGRVASQCLLDWLGVAIAGADQALVRHLIDHAAYEGGMPRATMIGASVKGTTRQAALTNGAASHALDYDDVSIAMLGHPTVAVMPAVFALAEARNMSGKELIRAFVAGYEIAVTLGDMVRPGHYAQGFHVTSTVGSVGSAAGAAVLLGLDQQQTAFALGIAVTQAAGLKSMFGTMCKPLHPGKANENGLLAAELAARGFDSRADAIECRQGFADSLSQNFAPERMTAPGDFHIRDNLFKYHASCYQTHAAIEILRGIRERHGLVPDEIERVEILQDSGADTVCNIPAPVSGLEAKFSLRFTAAMALAGVDTSHPASFSDDITGAPELTALRDRVEVSLTPDWPVTRSEIRVTASGGRIFEDEFDAGVPQSDLGLQERRLEDKFLALTRPHLGAEKANALMGLALDVEGLPDLGAITDILSQVQYGETDE